MNCNCVFVWCFCLVMMNVVCSLSCVMWVGICVVWLVLMCGCIWMDCFSCIGILFCLIGLGCCWLRIGCVCRGWVKLMLMCV